MVCVLGFSCLPTSLLNLRPPGARLFLFYVFTDLICLPTSGPSGGSIFLLVKKDRGERHAKGLQSRPLETALNAGQYSDVLCAYVFATVRLTRLSRLRRCRLFPRLCVLRCHERSEHSRNHLTAKLAKRWLFFECQRFRRTWSSTQESGGSSACNREACCKKAVLGFPAEPCKANTTGTPSDEPKSRKMHQCEFVERYARLPSFPRIKSQNPKGGFGALWHAFLLYLSSCNERWSHRRS